MVNLKFTDKQKNYFLDSISKLRHLHRQIEYLTPDLEYTLRTRFPELLGGFIPCLNQHTCFGSPFNRIVINKSVREDGVNGRLHTFEQIKYPPESVLNKVGYNRANLPNKSIFYAGYGKLNVGLEIKPQIGCLITESEWLQKQQSSINYLPIFHKWEIVIRNSEFKEDWIGYRAFLEKLDKNVSVVVEELYDFIADVFIAEVNSENQVEYIMSALFSDLFLFDPKFNIDCIYYPGVQIGLISSNIAIKPEILESLFDITEVTEKICTFSDDDFNKKILTYRTANAIDIQNCYGDITWANTSVSELSVLKLIDDYKVDLS